MRFKEKNSPRSNSGRSSSPVPSLSIPFAALAVFTLCLLGQVRLGQGVRGKVCSSIDVKNDALSFEPLINCTVVQGDLQIILIDHGVPGDFDGWEFPHLTEITGSLLLYRARGITTLRKLFPNLAIIRGNSLIFNYALVIYEMMDMVEIGLPGLVTIEHGSVMIYLNPKLCYVSTIDWSLVVKTGMEDNYIKDNKAEHECANVCPGNQCLHLSQSSHQPFCWNNFDCQKVCTCSSGCRQDLGNTNRCCHTACVGGCIGPSSSDCLACKYFLHNGNCIDSCPKGTYEYLGHQCITSSECPFMCKDSNNIYWKLFEGKCIKECPSGYSENETNPRLCTPCDGDCYKECYTTTIDSITSIQKLKGCIIIRGNLVVSVRSGSQSTLKELEDYLSTIREVTGYVEISHSFILSSLNFLKNLEKIHGEQLVNGDYSLKLMDNPNMQHLFDWNSRKNLTLVRGKPMFHLNPKLCYKEIVKMLQFVGMDETKLEEKDISKTTNGYEMSCVTHKLNITITSFARAAFVGWNQFKTDDYRDLLGFTLFYRKVLPGQKVTEFDGQFACGYSEWTSQDISSDSRATALVNLKPWTDYAVYVRTYTTETANGAKSDITYFKTASDEPSAPENIIVSANSSSELILKWDLPSEPNGNVTHYIVSLQKQFYNQELFSKRDYCQEGLTNTPEETEKDVHKNATSSNDDCNCPCDETVPINQDTASFMKTFENFLHNLVFVRRPDLNDECNNYRIKRNSFEDDLHQSVLPEENLKESSSHRNSTVEPSNETAVFPVPDEAHTWKETVFYNTHLAIKGLDHFSFYLVSIRACNDAGCGDEDIGRGGTTLPDPNKDYVDKISWKVTSNKTDNRKVLLSWEDPPDPNGLIIFYDIEYVRLMQTSENDEKDDGDETPSLNKGTMSTIVPKEIENDENQDEIEQPKCISHSEFLKKSGYELTELEPGNYSVRIRASSLAGPGPWSPVIVVFVPDVPDKPEGTKPPPSSQNDYLSNIGIVVGSILGVSIIIFVALFVFWYASKKRNSLPNGVLYASVNPEYLSSADVYVPDEWEFPREKVQLSHELGQGSFGMVYEGIAKDIVEGETETKVAVKTVNDNASIRDRIEFLNEASVMKAFSCIHVVRLLGVVSKGQPTFVIMELMAQGDLKNWLRSHRPDQSKDNSSKELPSLKQLLRTAGEIADGMAYLSAKKFVHRDLAARNCMVAEDGTVKIGDFGMTRDIYETDYYRKGGKGLLPVRWMAPESLKDGVFTSYSDVWSYGVVLWELSTLAEQPYQGLSNEQVLKFVIDGQKLEKPSDCHEELHQMMCACWQYHPKLRPKFVDILEDLDKAGFLAESFHQDSYYYNREQETSCREPADATLESMALMDDTDYCGGSSSGGGAGPSDSQPSGGEEATPTSMNDYVQLPKNGLVNGVQLPMNGGLFSELQQSKCTSC